MLPAPPDKKQKTGGAVGPAVLGFYCPDTPCGQIRWLSSLRLAARLGALQVHRAPCLQVGSACILRFRFQVLLRRRIFTLYLAAYYLACMYSELQGSCFIPLKLMVSSRRRKQPLIFNALLCAGASS